MNLLVPGTGAILLGRPWLGVALAAWFLAGSELAILGLLVAPAILPEPLSISGLAAAGAAWLAAQILLIRRIRFLRSLDLPREMAILHRFARRALARGDYPAVRAAIALGLSMDDSDVVLHVLRARLLALTSRPAKARRAWQAAAALDADGAFGSEIQQHLHDAAED